MGGLKHPSKGWTLDWEMGAGSFCTVPTGPTQMWHYLMSLHTGAYFRRGLKKLVLPPCFCMSPPGRNRGLDEAQFRLQILSSLLSQLPSSSCSPNYKSSRQMQESAMFGWSCKWGTWALSLSSTAPPCPHLQWTGPPFVLTLGATTTTHLCSGNPTFTKVEGKCQRMITWRLLMLNGSSWASFLVGLNGHK